jgi:hydroxymethylpyrimidine pyrophosphatase-like HAD family hydrolase
MATIIIFDLDDTLVNHRMKIPRQTYHMLNKFLKEKYFIGILTFNCLVPLIANETNLYHYTSSIVYNKHGDRNSLFQKCLETILERNKVSHIERIFYVDDRKDHLQIIQENNSNIILYHVTNMYELYQFKYLVDKKELN